MGGFSRMRSGLAGLVLAAGIATGPAMAQKVALDVFYAQPSFAKYHEPIAEAFMKANPNVTITFRAPPGRQPPGEPAPELAREVGVVRLVSSLTHETMIT